MFLPKPAIFMTATLIPMYPVSSFQLCYNLGSLINDTVDKHCNVQSSVCTACVSLCIINKVPIEMLALPYPPE